MAERKKVKPAAPVETTTRVENSSVGETLRAARLAKGIEVDEVSHTIHIRPTQLRAIEENDIESLPGMTYAVGFVRSYANYLGLNGAEIVHRFKAEQGHTPAPSKLSFPEPIAESRVPDPMMVGVGAFLAVIILVLWTVYSNLHGGSKTAEQVPAAPAATSVTDGLPSAATTTSAPAAATTPEGVLPAATMTTPSVTTPAASATPDTAMTIAPAPGTPVAPAITAATPPATAVTPPVAEAAKPAAVKTDDDSADDEEDSAPAAETAAKTDDKVITIKKGKTRIALRATQATWVQVTDATGTVLYRKVLRPGEQYSVPDQPGLVLDTANAGGLEISVDGKGVQSIGKAGEILRGIALDPKNLKVQHQQVRN